MDFVYIIYGNTSENKIVQFDVLCTVQPLQASTYVM